MHRVGTDDPARKLAAALEGAMRRTGQDPAAVAAELGGASVGDVIARDLAIAEAAEARKPGPPSAALAGAVDARRNRAAEPAEDPAPRPPAVPKPKSSPARERLLERTRAAAPLFSPQQWEKSDYGFARWLARGADGRTGRVVAALPRLLSLRLRRACLALEKREIEAGHEWTPRRRAEWRHKVARVLAAIAVTLFRKAGPTERLGMQRMTKGISIGMLRTLVHNPDTGAPYCERRMIELLDELEAAGVFYREQPPAALADPTTIGPSGHALNLYYFTARACGRPTREEQATEPDAPGGDWTPPAGSQARQTLAPPPTGPP